MTQDIHIVLSSNEKYKEFLFAAIRSLVRHTSQLSRVKFHILSRDLRESTKEKIHMLTHGQVDITKVDITLFENFPQMKIYPHLSVESYFRYLIPDLWPDLNRALYMDCDTIAKDDICKLWDLELGDCMVGACEEGYDYFLKWKQEIGIKGFYFNAGVMILDLKKFREHGIVEKLFSKTLEVGDRAEFADQDILNVVLDGNVKLLPARYNITVSTCQKSGAGNQNRPEFLYKIGDLQQAVQSPGILHYNSPLKPTHLNCVHTFKHEWFRYAEDSLHS